MTEHFDQETRSHAVLPRPGGEHDDALLRGPGAGTFRRLDRLLATPSGLRSGLLRSEEFQDLDLAAFLRDRAAASQLQAPRLSEHWARLAFEIAERTAPDPRAGRIGLADAVKARACVIAGNARRLELDLPGADAMLRKAVFHLTGPPSSRERAFYCRHLALLRADQGTVEEAVSLLWRAALIHRERREPGEEGRCLAQLGFLFLEQEQFGRAVPPLTQARRALSPTADADLSTRCALALACCHAALGDCEESRRLLRAATACRLPNQPSGANTGPGFFARRHSMETTQTTQTDLTSTEMPAPPPIDGGTIDGMILLATIWIELKPERIQESLAAAGDPVALTLQLAILQSQTVTFSFTDGKVAISFNNTSSSNGDAALSA